jgi:ribosomal protein S18 acetylase RimI-like enzyme
MNSLKLIKLTKTSENIELVQKIFESAPEYFLNVSGDVAVPTDSEDAFNALPPNFEIDKKHVLGIYFEEKLIGVIDCLIGYPASDKAYIGLLILNESYQNKGLGKITYNELEKYLHSYLTLTSIRLSVVESNETVLNYWEKMGFSLTGEVKPYSNKKNISKSILMEKIFAFHNQN